MVVNTPILQIVNPSPHFSTNLAASAFGIFFRLLAVCPSTVDRKPGQAEIVPDLHKIHGVVGRVSPELSLA